MSATTLISDTTLSRPDHADPSGGEGAPRSHPVYPLTWLRGIAALAVVTFHAYQLNRTGAEGTWPWSGAAHQAMLGTDLFVEMFFVLSGFVLWLPIARTALEGRQGRPGWVLLFRRMARLLPLYYAVVLVVWGMSNPSLPGHWQDLLLHLSFTHIYSDQYIFWTDGPAWSLAVEFHFYVLMAISVPLVHAGVRRMSTRRGRLGIALVLPALLTVVGLGYLLWETTLADVAPDNWSVLFSPLSRAADFGIGTGLAVAAAAGVRLGARARFATAVLGLAALVALVATRPATLAGEWWHPAYAVAIGVALTAVVLHDGPWPRVLELPALSWIGGLGYGIYLIHEPVMRAMGGLGLLPEPRTGSFFLMTAALVAVPSVALAWLSSRTIERAGVNVMSTIDRQGRPKDYYAHLDTAGTGGTVDAGNTPTR